MDKNSKYILVAIPGIIAFVLEFFSEELLAGGMSQNTFFTITRILWGISLVGFGVIYWNSRKQKVNQK